MQLRMLKHAVGKGRHVMKTATYMPQSVAITTYAIVATERAGYVLYRALVLLLESDFFVSATRTLAKMIYETNHNIIIINTYFSV